MVDENAARDPVQRYMGKRVGPVRNEMAANITIKRETLDATNSTGKEAFDD